MAISEFKIINKKTHQKDKIVEKFRKFKEKRNQKYFNYN